MKQREFEKCIGCGQGVAAKGVHFYRVAVEQFVLDHKAIGRQHGLELVTGSPALAQALGPDEDLAVRVASSRIIVCAECSLPLPAAALLAEAEDADG